MMTSFSMINTSVLSLLLWTNATVLELLGTLLSIHHAVMPVKISVGILAVFNTSVS